MKKDIEKFLKEGNTRRIAEMRFQFYEHQRQGIIKFITEEMLKLVKRERKEIIFKLETTRNVRPGTFITPIDQLTGTQETGNGSLKNSQIMNNDNFDEYLRTRDNMETKKLNIILRNDEKYNDNLKNNMKFELERIHKSNQIEALYPFI